MTMDGGGKFVDVGKAEILHLMVHIVAQVLGKAGAGLGREGGGQNAEGQRRQGAQHQNAGLGGDHLHVLQLDAVVIQVGHDQGDEHLHGDLADHAQRAEQRRPLIFPDAPGKSSYHVSDSSLILRIQALAPMLSMARRSMEANSSRSSGEKPATTRASLSRMTRFMVS